MVIVGDLIGSGASQEQAVVGETPNLAARLQAIASPNSIVIGPNTRRVLADLFDYQDLGLIDLKGIVRRSEPTRCLVQYGGESFFRPCARTTPLIGRDEEVDLLMRRWDRAKQGNGSVVLVCGEPGIGKSSLTQAVQDRLGDEPHIRLRYFCSPHHQDAALFPVITQLERAAGFRKTT